MAGHSKWDNIKHRKGAQDAKRGKVFAKLSKEITMTALTGIPDPNFNAALRMAIEKAKAKSMPKKNIKVAIDKAIGNSSGKTYKELSYGANVSGVSFLINCLTDNTNRATSEVQRLVSRAGGKISSAASVLYIFDRKGVLAIASENKNADEMMMLALDAGAEDFQVQENSFFIYTSTSKFYSVKDNMEKQTNINFKMSEVRYLPNQEMQLPVIKCEKILHFISLLEEHEDIQNVYHNLNLKIEK